MVAAPCLEAAALAQHLAFLAVASHTLEAAAAEFLAEELLGLAAPAVAAQAELEVLTLMALLARPTPEAVVVGLDNLVRLVLIQIRQVPAALASS